MPVYKDLKYSITHELSNRINIDYFDLLTVAGCGGFSKVLLGWNFLLVYKYNSIYNSFQKKQEEKIMGCYMQLKLLIKKKC